MRNQLCQYSRRKLPSGVVRGWVIHSTEQRAVSDEREEQRHSESPGKREMGKNIRLQTQHWMSDRLSYEENGGVFAI